MSSVIPKDLRLRGIAAACALLAVAACGGGDDAAEAAAPAKSADSASAPAAAATPSTPVPATTPAAQQPDAILDSAMTPAQAAEVAKAKGPVQGPVNVGVLADYELTMPRVRQMMEGSRQLALLQERRPGLRDSIMVRTPDPNLLYQRLNSIPEARDALARAGLTPQAYATGTAALLQAIMILEYKRQGGQEPPVEYNRENVDFIQEHLQEIMQMMSEIGRSMPAPSQQPPRP